MSSRGTWSRRWRRRWQGLSERTPDGFWVLVVFLLLAVAVVPLISSMAGRMP